MGNNNNYKRRLKMNKFKKISTLFALALISQCSYAKDYYPSSDSKTTVTNSPYGQFSDKTRYDNSRLSGAIGSMYTPNDQKIYSDSGDVTSALQNILQDSNVDNRTTLNNKIHADGLYSSDFVNNLTNNTTAMSSNVGSSYNSSNNNINTTNTDSSTNTNTTTLDDSRTMNMSN